MAFLVKYFYLFILFIFILKITKNFAFEIDSNCPKIFHHIFEGYAPVGNRNAGNFSEFKESKTISSCVLECCKLEKNCNAAFLYNSTCYHVKCANSELCLPLKRPNITSKLQMVLVYPTDDNIDWMDILKKSELSEFIENYDKIKKNNINYFNKYEQNDLYTNPSSAVYAEELPNRLNNIYNLNQNIGGYEAFINNDQYINDEPDIQMDENKFYNEQLIPCEYGIDSLCPENEICVIKSSKSRNGICKCKENFIRNENGKCINTPSKNEIAKILAEKLLMKNIHGYNDIPVAQGNSESTEIPTIKKLTVSVNSKEVQAPDTETVLSAYVVPDEKSSGDKYSYSWMLISKPNGAENGTMTDQTKDEVKLSNLSEGLYRFKVSVTGNGTSGEAYANVTVLPKKRINTPPIVVITPKEQTVKLPNKGAILDGSSSKDDSEIISWRWELVSGPIGYQPALPETSTLQLNDLSSPGNYTFKLTVTDSDKAQNSTTATITVLKGMDYPPNANAGQDVILYLPHNNVTLNGSLSTDDREIVAWEWTKDSNDQSKAVDMQNTRTPFLKLSNLEEGYYTFVLKVSDASNQTSNASVHVFVKPPTNSPPIANAGKNITINLPQTWVVLNGSESKDDIGITGFYWKQISGPTNSIIINANASVANATALTVGQYLFELTVTAHNNNTGSDRIYIKVVQEKNAPPIANGGGDLSVTLPVSVITLNGSKSSDDLGIVNWTWTRESGSLAVGNIIGNTNQEPVLMLTNVVAGRYLFRLTVSDDQGLTGTDTVSIIVHPDPLIMNLVELTLTMEARVLTQSELDSLEQKLILLLGDNIKFYRRDVKIEQKTKEAVIVFYVERINQDGKQVLMSGQEVETILKEKFWRDASILGAAISDIRTTICQNTCSGHGVCNSETRACLCETFWMPDIFYFWGVAEANCDWSILYVIIGVFIGFLFLSGVCWSITCLCRRTYKPRPRSKPQKYALLGTQDDEIQHSKVSYNRGNTLSESETDSDVLFESRSKTNGILRSNGDVRNGGHKYSVTRLGRRIKT